MRKVVFKKDSINGYSRNNIFIEKGVKIRAGAIVWSGNIILGNSELGASEYLPYNHIVDTTIGDNCLIGPFARLRPESVVADNCKIGNFVEIKKSTLGTGTKVAHLTYIGDASVGNNCNVGCGVVFCNYDGKNKHKSIVGNNVFIGSNCNLVAPIIIESDSIIAAGSTLTENVPEKSLAIARSRQVNKLEYKKKE